MKKQLIEDMRKNIINLRKRNQLSDKAAVTTLAILNKHTDDHDFRCSTKPGGECRFINILSQSFCPECGNYLPF